MKLKKSLSVLLVGAIAMSMVACSEPETEKVDGGSAAPIEKNKDEETKQEEVVLVDDELAKISITEKKKDVLGAGYTVLVENKSDKKIIVQTRDVSIDGTMEEAIFSPEVMPGKKANDMMQFMNIQEIDNLKNVEGKITILGEDFMEIQSYDMNIE